MRNKHPLTAALAVLAWSAVLLQLYLSIQLSVTNGKGATWGVVAFLGYFTVLTNILVCVALTIPLVAPSSTAGRFFSHPSVLTGVAASIALVGITYHFLLRNIWDPQGLQWIADVLLHYAMPILYLVYWWFAVPKSSLRWTDPLLWCAYPAAYLAYALGRGALIDSYPYPFIDVLAIGYAAALRNTFVLMLGFIALGLLLVAIGRRRSATTSTSIHTRA